MATASPGSTSQTFSDQHRHVGGVQSGKRLANREQLNKLWIGQPAIARHQALRRYATTPPPKLVAPMMRNAIKIWRKLTTGGELTLGCSAGVSLMTVGLISLKSINRRRLRNPQLHPISADYLKLIEDCQATGDSLLVQFIAALKFPLEGTLGDELFIVTARPPYGNGGLGLHYPFAEIESADVQQKLGYRHMIDEIYMLPLGAFAKLSMPAEP